MAKSPGLDVVQLEFSGEQDGGALLVLIDQRGILFKRNGVDVFVSKNEARTIARHLDDGCGTVWRQDFEPPEVARPTRLDEDVRR